MTGFELMVYGALCAAAAGPVQSGPLTIEQAAAIAESRAFAVQLQQSGLLRANATVRQAESQLGPQITGNASLGRAGQAIYGTTGAGGAPVLFSPVNSATYGVSLSLPLDLSGALHANLRSAEATRRSQRENLRAALNDARLNARTAFLNVLRAQATVGVQEQSLKNAEAQALQARQQLEQVQVAKIDVDRLEAAVVQRRTDLVDAQNSLQIAYQQLNLTLARPIDTPTEAVDVPTLPEPPTDANALDQAAQASRPETRAAREVVEARRQITSGAQRANIPNLALSLSTTRNVGDVGFGGARANSALGLSLSVPLFDSGNIRSRVSQFRQDEEQAKIQLAQTQLSVSQEVRAATTNLLNARVRLDNANRQIELAQEVFRIAQVRQAAGAGTYVEVVDAETTLTNARNQLVRARYDILTAYAQLQRAVGNDQLSTTPVPTGASR
ncbi:TolC family protein [bacterium]|nr:MAG: TolC family protein [bacterium]